MRATIVYGFLGAGKTTLLRSLVPQLAALESTALLVNEFGIEGVDQVVLASDDLTVRQLVGGCVCCEVRGDLMVALDEIHRTVRPERLVIEPTGLASPDTLANVFASPAVRSMVQVDSVITVLDATRYALVRDHLGEFFPNQVRHADLVLVNKTDAASEEQRLDARTWARGLNAEAAIVDSVYCKVDPDLLLATVRHGGERVTSWVGARKTPHRLPPKTPASASPPGEGEERRRPEEVDAAHPASASAHGDLGASHGHSPEDPSPQPSPPGEGERGDADGAGFASGRPLGDSGVGVRKTPHRFRPKTPEPASPPGEGEGADRASGAPEVDFDSRVPHGDLVGSGLERVVLDTGDLPVARVDAFVGDLAAGVYGEVVRAKGFVPAAEGCALVDVVLGAWEVRRFGPAPLYIDVIGRNLKTNEMETAVTHGFKELACTA